MDDQRPKCPDCGGLMCLVVVWESAEVVASHFECFYCVDTPSEPAPVDDPGNGLGKHMRQKY
jgi:hypothetical protein